jgi:hypothetical protein
VPSPLAESFTSPPNDAAGTRSITLVNRNHNGKV